MQTGLTQEDEVGADGPARTADGHLGDHAQGALRADEEVLQVVARVVLLHRRHTVHHVAIGQHLHNGDSA